MVVVGCIVIAGAAWGVITVVAGTRGVAVVVAAVVGCAVVPTGAGVAVCVGTDVDAAAGGVVELVHPAIIITPTSMIRRNALYWGFTY